MNKLRAVAKQAGLRVLEVCGANGWAAHRGGARMWIPCYHGVVSQERPQAREGYENTVSVAAFEQQLQWLGRHYRFVDLAGALRWLEQPEGGRPVVLVSFDDGYRNNLTLAAPVLRRLGIPAVFFLSTNYVGSDRMLWPLEVDARLAQNVGCEIPPLPGSADGSGDLKIPAERAERAALAFRMRQSLKGCANARRVAYLEALRAATQLDRGCVDWELNAFLSWDEARQLAGFGFDIGSHTVEHPILSRLTAAELEVELRDSRQRIEHELGREIRTLAYPNGGKADYSPEVIAMARQSGYEAAFAVDDGWQKPLEGNRYEISRTIVPGHLTAETFAFIASGMRGILGR